MSNARSFAKLIVLTHSVFLVSSCMTSSKQEQLESRLDKLQDQVEQQYAKTDSSSKSTFDELKNQIQLTQGTVDELNNRMKKMEQSAGGPGASIKSSPVHGEYDLATMQRQLARLQLATAPRVSTNRTGKLPHNVKNAGDLEKILKNEFANGNIKQAEQIANAVLGAKGANNDLLSTALEYRGEAKFQQHAYKEAAMDLSYFIEAYPKSKRYSRALLLTGDSYVYLKNHFIAMSYYQECAKDYAATQEGKACQTRLDSLLAQNNEKETPEGPQN